MRHKDNCQSKILNQIETVGTSRLDYRYVEVQTGCVNDCPVGRKVLWYNNMTTRGRNCKHWCVVPQSQCCRCEVDGQTRGWREGERASIAVKGDLGIYDNDKCEICEGVDDREAMV